MNCACINRAGWFYCHLPVERSRSRGRGVNAHLLRTYHCSTWILSPINSLHLNIVDRVSFFILCRISILGLICGACQGLTGQHEPSQPDSNDSTRLSQHLDLLSFLGVECLSLLGRGHIWLRTPSTCILRRLKLATHLQFLKRLFCRHLGYLNVCKHACHHYRLRSRP